MNTATFTAHYCRNHLISQTIDELPQTINSTIEHLLTYLLTFYTCTSDVVQLVGFVA